MQNILITGANGFVGSSLAKRLKKHFSDSIIIGVDNFLSSDPQNISTNYDYFITLSATDTRLQEYIQKHNIDTIFHLAAFSANINSLYNPRLDIENSLLSTLNLLELTKNNKNIERFVYSSAGCSMGLVDENGKKFIVENEEVSLKLDTPYQISKVTGEMYCNFYNQYYHIPTVRARFQNVYGEGEILGAGLYRGSEATIWRNVTPIFIYKALKNEPLFINGNGEDSRDFIYINDICDGLIHCATIKDINSDVFNLATGVPTTIKELAQKIIAISNSSSKIEYLPKRDWDNSFQRFASTEKSKKILDFEAKTNIDIGLKKTIDWTQKNMDMIEKSINKHKAFL